MNNKKSPEWGFVFCPDHDNRIESNTQRLNELTQQYMKEHPEMVEVLFVAPKRKEK